MDLKFLANTQNVEVVFEGRPRRFEVVAISASDFTSDDEQLAHSFQDMSLVSQSALWTVTWDTFVSVVNDAKESKPEAQVRYDIFLLLNGSPIVIEFADPRHRVYYRGGCLQRRRRARQADRRNSRSH